jgi:hypothetical protein
VRIDEVQSEWVRDEEEGPCRPWQPYLWKGLWKGVERSVERCGKVRKSDMCNLRSTPKLWLLNRLRKIWLQAGKAYIGTPRGAYRP